MKRRNVLFGIGATISAGAAVGTGAFSNVSSQRQLTVTVAGDAAGLLSLRPYSGPNGEYADDSGDKLALSLGDDSAGLTRGSQYEFDATLRVGNQGTQPVYVWTEVDSETFADDALYLYQSDAATQFDASNPAEVGVGGDRVLGVYVDTTGVETDSYEASITVHASDEPPEGTAPGDEPAEPSEYVDSLVFDSTASLLAEDGFLDESSVVVTAMDTATSTDADGNGDATAYPDGEDLPLVAADGPVVAFGFPFAQNDVSFGQYGNEEVLLNVLDEYAGSGTVLWDESHGQFYDLASHSSFAGYAEENGYEVTAASSLPGNLADASAVVVTTPADAFTENELSVLSMFASDGGLVVLMDQSDFSDYDQTANLNEVADALDTSIRFNDNQVVDAQNNAGSDFVPVTSSFNTDDYGSLLAAREDLGPELDASEEYEVDVVNVTDGDTVEVQFDDGTQKTVRTVGHDTPETSAENERPQEWEGIDDPETLLKWGDEATSYAEDALDGKTVTLSFDEGEGLRGNYGRLLGLLEVDGSLYNEQVVADGYARVYDSGLGRHDEFWSAEADARAAGRGLWADSDVEATPVVGDDPVSELFVPYATSVTATGGLADERVPVASEGGEPLVAVDEDANVAMLGGPLPDESFESAEGGPGVGDYGNYVFLTNLVDAVAASDRSGDVLVDGGHGQFGADYALAAEDAAYYQRYLEGHSIGLEGTNDYGDEYGPDLADARALVVTAPSEPFTDDEIAAVASFAESGGAVVLASASGDAAADARGHLDDLAAELGTDLRTGTVVTDASNNVGSADNPATTNFDESAFLFEAYGSGDGGDSGTVASVVDTYSY
ncbi:endonuclease domain protein [Halobacterium hubeiense]|uniref:Endonuclease domain protein n=1 Tax=Halobacterium hubeiense TaxID=1407499 RepID=A0A0U5H3C0_9EURY|nr:thermonuclease family protein [Halobacterium hubeiense]CQH59722.1 endonuclease domain protein [Halobacterium hubeiense]